MAQTITLNFKIIGQSLERLDDNRIVEKAKNYINAHFEFNELWDDTTKAILIEGSCLRYKVYLNENNECLIPNRAVRHDGFTLTVVGEDTDKNITITTSELYIAVGKGIKSDEEMESIYEITSQSLDVNKNGGTCNLEIKDEEKFYYEMQENDFSNMQHESGNQWSLDLSETIENVITEFKKRIGVDWDRLGIQPPVPDMLKCVYTPTKKVIVVGEEEITYYMLSAVDSYGDTSVAFFYQNDSWHVIFITGNFVDNETFNLRMADKQDVLVEGEGITISGNEISTDRSKVVANPILVGDEPNLEGTEIDGIKYKVGGGGKLYRHDIYMFNSYFSCVLVTSLYSSNSTPMIKSDFYTFLTTKTGQGYLCSGKIKINNIICPIIYCQTTGMRYISGDGSTFGTQSHLSESAYDVFTDTVTEV